MTDEELLFENLRLNKVLDHAFWRCVSVFVQDVCVCVSARPICLVPMCLMPMCLTLLARTAYM